MTTKSQMRLEASADPAVQLEQALNDAREQHGQLREQAGNVIANQKRTEMRLNRVLEELEAANTNARQALRMAADAERAGDKATAARYNEAAESFAAKMLGLEKQTDELRDLHFQATEAANQAKGAVEQNSEHLKAKLEERQKLLNQLDQAKMQEQMNRAMSSLSESVGQDVPTFDDVRQKIEARYAKARGMSELSSASTDSAVLEVERAAKKNEARDRLAQLRAELGLPSVPPRGLPELDR